MRFKFFEHTADVMFQAFGKEKEEAFLHSFLALMEAIYGRLKVKENIKKEILVEGEDDESLLYNFLEEFLFLLDAEGFLASKIKNLKIKNKKLSATILGDHAENYEFTNDVKAVTYNQMFVKNENQKWIIQVVLDV